MNIFSFIKQAALIALCFLFTSQAYAWEQWGCRKASSNTHTFNASPAGFGGSFSHWRTSFAVAGSRINKGSRFFINSRLDNDNNVNQNNGESEVWWVVTGCSATAYTTNNGCTAVEADITVSNVPSCVQYEDDMSDKYAFRNFGTGLKRTFETTMIHEIGHTAGMAHENDEHSIMGSDYTVITSNGPSLRSYISHDLNQGLIALYGNRSSKRIDVSATTWRYATTAAQEGDYAIHERTEIYNSSGTALPSENYKDCVVVVKPHARQFCEQIYTVDQGQQVQVEFQFENLSNDTQTAQVGYYLSTTDLITTTDTLIGTESVTVAIADTATPRKKTLTIPTNLETNKEYFIGAIIDYTDALSESDELNNAAYHVIKTSNVGGSSSGGSSSGGSSSGGSSSGGSSSGGSSSGGSSSGGSSSGGSSSGGALTNGVTVTGLGATTGTDLNFYIDVPNGATNLTIVTSGGTGDLDMYVKLGSVPTDSSYDCRPYGSGNGETCGDAEDPLTTAQGRWYVRLNAYQTFANATLTASYTGGGSSSGGSSSGGSSSGGSSSGGSSSGGSSSGGSSSGGSSSGGSSSGGSSSGGSSSGGSSSGGSSSGGSSSGGSSSGGSSSGGSSSGGIAIENGRTVAGLAATAGNRTVDYYIDVPSGASNLVIKIAAGTGATGDADMFVKKDSVPTDSSYDCRPYITGNAETCGTGGTALATSEGRFYINLKAYSNFTNVDLTASYTAGSGSSSGGSSSGGSSSGGSSSGGSSSGGSVADACASEAAHTASSVTMGDAICLRAGTSTNSIAYHYVNVPANTASITIKTAHGTGNGNLYYNASTWATTTANTQSSTGSANTESITVSNPASGNRFFSVTGIQSGMALIVEAQ